MKNKLINFFDNHFYKIGITFISLMMCVGIFFWVGGCTSKTDFENAKKQLESQGYTNVTFNGMATFCCDARDTFSTSFKAEDNKGNDVEGCACSSISKGVTIRYK